MLVIKARRKVGFFFVHPKLFFKMKSAEDIMKTEKAITLVKATFEKNLSGFLNLDKVSSPLAVMENTGLNDELNGVEKPVRFNIRWANGSPAVIVHSLAKWKRLRLSEFDSKPGMGIITDMRALRPEESYSPIHSIYVDQWDWEKHINESDRSLSYVKKCVRQIYKAIKTTELSLQKIYKELMPVLPDKVKFIHAEELLQAYPQLLPKAREAEAAKKHGAIFIIGIGAKLSNGHPHDGRAPDYDDWTSLNEDGYKGLNGDLIFWNPLLEDAFEISSMGIRVNHRALKQQLQLRGCPEKASYPFHKMLLDGRLPQTIGGGIGQSRLCMFLMRKPHIGQVQVGIWPQGERERLARMGIHLL